LSTHVWDPDTGVVQASAFANDSPEADFSKLTEMGKSGQRKRSRMCLVPGIRLKTSSWSAATGFTSLTHSDYVINETEVVAYEALSYTLGDPALAKQILLNGYTFDVTATLWLALRYLRKKNFSRILCVDALCVNQKEVDEKVAQVGQMHLIYKHAQEVVVWLDVSILASDLAFEFAEKIYYCSRPK